MAVIYLKHDVHGAKVACSEQEAAYDEKSGWVRYTVADPTRPVPVSAPVDAVPETPAPLKYVVTEFNGMQPENTMPKPRRRKATVNDDV